MPSQPAGGTAAAPVYRNPLRAASVTGERIDQGVDYAGQGPIYALGPGVVLMTKNSGWPGGAFIAYRLTEGPARGHIVYFAEDIQPVVHVGQHVDANTVIGYFAPAGGGIEAGWAAPPPNLGTSLARLTGQWGSANRSTAYGHAFNTLMMGLGAPAGIPTAGPPVGTAPAWASAGGGTGSAPVKGTLLSGPAGPVPGCITGMILAPVLIPWRLACLIVARRRG